MNYFSQAWSNAKSLPTTITGIGVFLSSLPQIPAVQQIMHLSPLVANEVTGIAALGASLILIFGAGQPKAS